MTIIVKKFNQIKEVLYSKLKANNQDIHSALYIGFISFVYHMAQNLICPFYHTINSNNRICTIVMILISTVPLILFIIIIFKHYTLNLDAYKSIIMTVSIIFTYLILNLTMAYADILYVYKNPIYFAMEIFYSPKMLARQFIIIIIYSSNDLWCSMILFIIITYIYDQCKYNVSFKYIFNKSSINIMFMLTGIILSIYVRHKAKMFPLYFTDNYHTLNQIIIIVIFFLLLLVTLYHFSIHLNIFRIMKTKYTYKTNHYISIVIFLILYNLLYNIYNDTWIISRNKIYKNYVFFHQINQISLIILFMILIYTTYHILKIIKKYIIKLTLLIIPLLWCFVSSSILYDYGLIDRISNIFYYFFGKSVNIILLLGIIQMSWYLNKRYSPAIKQYLYLFLSKKNHRRSFSINNDYLYRKSLFSNNRIAIISITQTSIITNIYITESLFIFIKINSIFIIFMIICYITDKYFNIIKQNILCLIKSGGKYMYNITKQYLLPIILILKK